MKFIRYAFLALIFVALSGTRSMAQLGGDDEHGGGRDRGGEIGDSTGHGEVGNHDGDHQNGDSVDRGRDGEIGDSTGHGEVGNHDGDHQNEDSNDSGDRDHHELGDTTREHREMGGRDGERGGRHGRFDVPIFRFLQSDSCRLSLEAMMADTDALRLESIYNELLSYRDTAKSLISQARAARQAHDTASWRQIRVQLQLLRIQAGGARAQLAELIHFYRNTAKRVLIECGRPPHRDRGDNDKGGSGHAMILKVTPIHPNPYNPANASAVVPSFEYSLASETTVRIDFSDAAGSLIATLVDGIQSAGSYTVQLPVANLQAGGYYIRVQAGQETQTLKFSLLR